MDVDGPAQDSGPSRAPANPIVESDGDIFDFDEATNLESRFFKEGYDSGFSHGRLHGLFEGRALGQEKGFEVWEELGFYEGFAEVCLGTLQAGEGGASGVSKAKDARALGHAEALLSLITTFPTTNPTPAASSSLLPPAGNPEGAAGGPTGGLTAAEQDLAGLMSSIRAKYRLLCTSVGARPRLQTAPSTTANGGAETEGVEGPIKGVDYGALRY